MEKGLSFQQMMLKQLHSQIKKKNKFIDVNLMLYTKTNLEQMVDINVKHITIKILEDSVKRKSMLTLGLVMGLYM